MFAKTRLALLVGWVTGSVAFPLLAQETTKNDTVVVTSQMQSGATKLATPDIETPQSVSIVTREQFEEQGATSVRQAVSYTPGVYSNQIGASNRFDYIVLRGIKREEIERGQVLAKPGSIKPHTKFESEVYILSKDEGGRHTPFFKGYRPQFYFRTTDVTGTIELPEGVEMVMPGDNIKMVVTLIHPIAMDDGLRFAIREGGRTVGAGVVAKVMS